MNSSLTVFHTKSSELIDVKSSQVVIFFVFVLFINDLRKARCQTNVATKSENKGRHIGEKCHHDKKDLKAKNKNFQTGSYPKERTERPPRETETRNDADRMYFLQTIKRLLNGNERKN